MQIEWSDEALRDLRRLYDFRAVVSERSAKRLTRTLATAPEKLLTFPRLGQQLEAYSPRDVRRLVIDSYELRYEIRGEVLHVLNLWHTREDR